jgi:hypothetical protein
MYLSYLDRIDTISHHASKYLPHDVSVPCKANALSRPSRRRGPRDEALATVPSRQPVPAGRGPVHPVVLPRHQTLSKHEVSHVVDAAAAQRHPNPSCTVRAQHARRERAGRHQVGQQRGRHDALGPLGGAPRVAARRPQPVQPALGLRATKQRPPERPQHHGGTVHDPNGNGAHLHAEARRVDPLTPGWARQNEKKKVALWLPR